MDDAVAGPGALSRRTDRGPAQKIRDLPDAQYGEAATYKDLQQQAPLAQTPSSRAPSGAGGGGAAPAGPSLVPLGAPTQRPDEPVTAGVDAGEGPDSSALGLSSPGVNDWRTTSDMVQSLLARNPNNSALAYMAARLQGRY
jgi:hypothetical protein